MAKGEPHKRRFYLRLSFYDNEGNTFGERAIEINSAWCGDRAGDYHDLRPPMPGTAVSISDAVEVLKVRELRREDFIRDAKRMGMALADYLEDKEGWHGTRRQALIEDLERKK